jgi:hypothetical protein
MRFRYLLLLGLFVPLALVSAQNPLSGGADAIRGQVEAAREAALASGAEEVLPQRLGLADNIALSSQSKYASGDYDGAAAGASEAYGRYLALKTILDAYNLKQEADDNDFITRDSENYDAGIKAGNSAVDLFDAGSLADAQKSAEQAMDSFTAVLNKGWTGYAEDQSGAAQTWRQSALDARAHVAVRDLFEDADTAFNGAFVSLRAEEYRDAAGLFDKAIELFRQSRDSAIEKRVKAEEAIRRAEQTLSLREPAKEENK